MFLLLACAVVFSFYLIEITFIHSNQGLITGGLEVFLEFLMFYMLNKMHRKCNEVKEFNFKWFFFFLGLGDLFYIIFYYYLNLSSRTFISSTFTTLIYNIAYFIGAYFLFRVTKSEQANKKKKLSLFVYLTCLPIALRLLVIPFIQINVSNLSLYFISLEISAIFGSYLLLTHAIICLISSTNYFWTNISAGMIILVVSDWALRVEKLIDNSPKFGFYESLYCLGICSLFISFYKKNKINQLELYSNNSLVSMVKKATIVASFTSIIFLSLSQYGSRDAIRFASVGLIFGIYLVLVIGLYLEKELKNFSAMISRISKDLELGKDSLSENLAFRSRFPLELINSFNEMVEMKTRVFKEKVILNNNIIIQENYSNIASQVSHDIRSPLAALEMISGSLGELPEDKRLIIRNSINRIRDIANSLLNKNNLIASDISIQKEVIQTESFSNTLLGPLVDSIITEKRIQYRNQIGVQIDFNQSKDSYGLFAKIQPIEFQRVLSNLINNAVEAFDHSRGSVELVIGTNVQNQIELTIKDNGKGIPADILAKLGKRGETYGKENGSGLGIFHAMETIKSFQGTMLIDSKAGDGTKISILLPRETEPAWFVPAIKLKANLTLIVFDDDQSIHQIWKGRLESVPNGSQIQVRNFSDPAELRKFYGKNFTDLDEALFLMDYEISGSSENGLDLIENLGIQKQSILVTSRYEEKNIRDRCEGLGVKLIPKSMSGFVPIEIAKQ